MIKMIFNWKSLAKIFMVVLICVVACNLAYNAFCNKIDVQKLPIVLVDFDKSHDSKKLCENLQLKTNLTIVNNENIAIDKLANGSAQLVIIINKGYEKQLRNAKLSDLFTVYTGYNPAYSKLLLEVISEEVLRDWVVYKLYKENDLHVEIDFTTTSYNIEDVVDIKEKFVNNESDNVLNVENIDYKNSINIIIMFILSAVIILVQGYSVCKQKINGVLRRVILFHGKGEKFYAFKFIYESIALYLINLVIFGIIFILFGVSITMFVKLFAIYLFYLILVKCFVTLIIYLSNSLSLYNFSSFLFLLLDGALVGFLMFTKGFI